MFRLLESGLPKDPIFPADLNGLGYFINNEDEIRSIENPLAYFKFFLTKNDRYNEIQREMMNGAVREEVLKRIHELGLATVNIPLGTPESKPHIPILISPNISSAKRVVILFYEHTQDLGIFAHRVIGGRGGINEGSAVNFVKYIQSRPSTCSRLNSSNDSSRDPPAIVLTNMGQLRWWRKGQKAVTQSTWYALPQKSAVNGAPRFDRFKNTVPGNRNTQEHVAYIFKNVVRQLLNPEAKLEVIGVTDGAYQVVQFLNKAENWKEFGPRMAALALLAPYHNILDLTNPTFSGWLEKCGRAYTTSESPANTPLAPPSGSHRTACSGLGCPTYSLGEAYYSEVMLPKGYKIVLDWFQEVADTEFYENPKFEIFEDINKAEGETSSGGPGWTIDAINGDGDSDGANEGIRTEPQKSEAISEEIKLEQFSLEEVEDDKTDSGQMRAKERIARSEPNNLEAAKLELTARDWQTHNQNLNSEVASQARIEIERLRVEVTQLMAEIEIIIDEINETTNAITERSGAQTGIVKAETVVELNSEAETPWLEEYKATLKQIFIGKAGAKQNPTELFTAVRAATKPLQSYRAQLIANNQRREASIAALDTFSEKLSEINDGNSSAKTHEDLWAEYQGILTDEARIMAENEEVKAGLERVKAEILAILEAALKRVEETQE